MKALIIDDEKHVREAIRLLVPWQSYGIGEILEAQDGQAATLLIREHRPEIIFTDMMMPNMDGTALLEWAAEHAPASKIIVISGHDDFSFVRHALKYGGVDYILKPIDAEQLAGALTKAVEELKKEERRRSQSRTMSMELNQLKPLYLEQYVSKIIAEPGAYPAFEDTIRRELGVTEPVRRVRMAALNLELLPPAVREKFSSGLDLLLFSVTNICNELLKDRRLGYALRHWGKEHEIVLLFWGEGEQAPGLLTDMNEAIFMALKTKFHIGLGRAECFPQAAGPAYEQARSALNQHNLFDKDAYIHCFDPELYRQTGRQAAFQEYEEQIRFAVQGGHKDQIARALKPWFEELRQRDCLSVEALKLAMQQFALAEAAWTAAQPGGESGGAAAVSLAPYRIPVDADGHFDFEAWQSSVYEAACAAAAKIAGQDKERSIIQEIASYIEQHPQEDITLQDISERFFLSREYISRKFKQETNGNLSDFIASVRINRAKELLGNGQLRIAQIAELVGFQDEKYFSRVFKKWTGCSPNDYRKHHYAGDS